MKGKWLMILPGMILTAGCGNDERLEQMARETVASQREQNRMMHQQNQKLIETTTEVTRQGRALAEASKELVAQGAQARRELVAAHQEMRSELHAERLGVDRQRQDLEQERRAVARQRVLQPIIAESIKAIGLWLACLLPVGLAGYVLYSVNRCTDDQVTLNEMIVVDLTSDRPDLIPFRRDVRKLDRPGSAPSLPDPRQDPGERTDPTPDA